MERDDLNFIFLLLLFPNRQTSNCDVPNFVLLPISARQFYLQSMMICSVNESFNSILKLICANLSQAKAIFVLSIWKDNFFLWPGDLADNAAVCPLVQFLVIVLTTVRSRAEQFGSPCSFLVKY